VSTERQFAELRASLKSALDVERDLRAENATLLEEIEQLRAWHDNTVSIIATLAIYGEAANVAALVAKARELNEAKS